MFKGLVRTDPLKLTINSIHPMLGKKREERERGRKKEKNPAQTPAPNTTYLTRVVVEES